MIYCERCGVANRDGSRFCNECGLRLASGEDAPEEPLPSWLRDAAVAGYLWRGEMLLPAWLSELRPFRELYGREAVVLPPPVSEAPPPGEIDALAPLGVVDADELSFTGLEDEEGPPESDLLLLDDLDLPAETFLERVEAEPIAPPAAGPVEMDTRFAEQVQEAAPLLEPLRQPGVDTKFDNEFEAPDSRSLNVSPPEAATGQFTGSASEQSTYAEAPGGPVGYAGEPEPASLPPDTDHSPVTALRGLLLRPHEEMPATWVEPPVSDEQLDEVAGSLTETGVPGLDPAPLAQGEPTAGVEEMKEQSIAATDVFRDTGVSETAATGGPAAPPTDDLAARFRLAALDILDPQVEPLPAKKPKKGKR